MDVVAAEVGRSSLLEMRLLGGLGFIVGDWGEGIRR